MTAADMLRAEGHKKGLREGRKAGETNILLRLLRVRFGELGEATLARVRAARPKQLERWAERVLTAASLDEVFAKG